jgi:hypothetical protein
MAGQAYLADRMAGQAYLADRMAGQAYLADRMAGQAYLADRMAGQAYLADRTGWQMAHSLAAGVPCRWEGRRGGIGLPIPRGILGAGVWGSSHYTIHVPCRVWGSLAELSSSLFQAA